MIRVLTLAGLLAALAACHPLKGPGETGQVVYYDPERAISSDGLVYPRPR